MTFKAPIEDINFILNNLADLPGVLSLPGFEDISPDIVEAVLNENAKLAQQVVAPLNKIGDNQNPTLDNGVVTTSPGFKEAFKEYANAGWQGLNHSTDIGGQGLPKVVAAAASETMNAANLAFSLCPLLTDGVIEALTDVGTKEQQEKFIPPLLAGTWTGTMNLTEPQAGSDLAQVATRAVPQDDGSYKITGQKIFITYGEHDMAENIIHLVLARTPNAPKGVKGISLFIVPKFLVNDDGSLGARNDVWCASLEHKLGIHASPTAVLLYGDNQGEVGQGAVGYLVGQENEGLKYMFIMMNAARYAVGIQGIAVSEAALQSAQAYANERIQSQAVTGSDGPVAIVNHPDVQRMLGTMRGLTEGARALAYFAAAACDKSRHSNDEQEKLQNKALYEFLVPVVKGFSTELSLEVTSLGVQVHGGMGFIEETGVAQFYRDARILPIYEGTTAIQANDFLGRKIFRDGGAVAKYLIDEMQQSLEQFQGIVNNSADNSSYKTMSQNFKAAINDFSSATDFILENATKNIGAAFLGSVPYLMLAGIALSGWQLIKAAQVCIQTNDSSNPFYTQKLKTCSAYAVFVLPRTSALCTSITSGATFDLSVQQ